MVPMPVRVKPPPAEIGEIISPGCAALATTTPLEWRAHDSVIELHLGHHNRFLRHPDLFLGTGQSRPEHIALREGGFQRLRTDELPVGEPPLARIVPLGLDELGADLGDLGPGSAQLGFSQRELGLGLSIIEPGQHVALLDPHAFLDQDLGDFPGDLR